MHVVRRVALAALLALPSPLSIIWASRARADLASSIAWCESRGRQYAANGRVLRNGPCVGVFQLDERLYRAAARRLGYNIYTRAGNRAYARHLLATKGTAPWAASRSCWAHRR